MAGTKRTWDGHPLDTAPPATMSTDSPSIHAMFETFRNELDEHHDRRERLIKTSRDITALSKKIIFSLQRIRQINKPLPPKTIKEINEKFNQITHLFTTTLPDLTSQNQHRYQRQLSGAIQEFIEALSFHHYLTTQTLITLPEVRAHLPTGIPLTEEDYLMGLFDLTGEVMRFAVTTLSGSSSSPSSTEEGEGQGEGKDSATAKQTKVQLPSEQNAIVVDLRAMRAAIELLNIPRRHAGLMFRDMGRKIEVMQGSVEKVERAAYGILVRGSERPEGWRPDLSAGAGGAGEGEVY
ncbi:translin family protein [Aspergillus homomorphus CBS 101889]|uniref:Putative translin-associated factor TraX n=1 Tax=Aspergillus homomorphus (strain CBS 101889) TaxID=1450537 RepID=A0A395HVC9_ASPHC|nr:putative translin-associated factor TraX [Aspergillus homomorphus CBS 101889]RAL11892.1 putative translin-associated factor TraX [Aspergillus homomorphus CBS 101889]